jgi:hypothetical protein
LSEDEKSPNHVYQNVMNSILSINELYLKKNNIVLEKENEVIIILIIKIGKNGNFFKKL